MACWSESEKRDFREISTDMEDSAVSFSLKMLSCYLSRYYGKKVVILLDEYDTPMQEAYVNGFWKEMVAFTRSLFNATFKTNPYMERAIMTGITRVSIASCEALESMFSDLNCCKMLFAGRVTSANTWEGEELCTMPETMQDVLLDCFTVYLEYKAITTNGEISEVEQGWITAQRQTLLGLCIAVEKISQIQSKTGTAPPKLHNSVLH